MATETSKLTAIQTKILTNLSVSGTCYGPASVHYTANTLKALRDRGLLTFEPNANGLGVHPVITKAGQEMVK